MIRPRFRSIAAAFAITCVTVTASALAQYVWVGADGVKQYSDRPPPPSVPANRILKQPGNAAAPADVQKPVAADTAAAQPAKPPTLAEQNAAFLKRRAEQAEREKKEAEQAKLNTEKARNCQRARVYHDTLASGQRIVTTDKNGERAYLSDDQRTQELRDTDHLLAECK